jgi:2-dehydro-3-deoxygluconokinase
MTNICCFGELLLRFAPTADWAASQQMPVFVGGAELNVATALANWQLPVQYITALPDNYMATQVLDELQKRQLKTNHIQLGAGRLGTYYLPVGSELKNAGVIYDRSDSVFAQLQPGSINWQKALAGCSWLHCSAISPALNANVAAVCLEAMETAAAMGLTISMDLNYRNKLWQYGVPPTDVMLRLVQHCQVIMGNIWAANALLGIPTNIEKSDGMLHAALVDAAKESIGALKSQYPSAKHIAYTFRLEKTYWAILQSEGQTAISSIHAMQQVVDKVGSGDCFMAGLIYGLHQQQAVAQIVEFSAAAAVGKLQEAGDATAQSVDDIIKKMNYI